MTTLTANVRGQPGHCVHKLPSSCRLTALPICCACQDKRPHAPLYQKYIDGVGFVLRGRRQERYCWQCKVFWDKRVDDSGLPQADTRIPETPDQTEFISKWFEWHAGFRSIQRADGVEERQAMVGEPLAEVDIGCLPRTVADLRNGLLESSDQMLIKARQRNAHRTQEQDDDEWQRDDLDQIPDEDRLFDPESPSITASAPVAPPSRRRNDNFPSSVSIDASGLVASLRDEFETTFNETFAAHLSEATRLDLFDTNANFPRFSRSLDNLSTYLLRLFLVDLNDSAHTLDEGDAASLRRFIANSLESQEHALSQETAPNIDMLSLSTNPSVEQVPALSLDAGNSENVERSSVAERIPQPLSRSTLISLNITESQSLISQFEADLARVRRRLGHLAPLGTQEDVQDPNYVSPVANMFNSYYTQHLERQAERRRRAQEAGQEAASRAPGRRETELQRVQNILRPVGNNFPPQTEDRANMSLRDRIQARIEALAAEENTSALEAIERPAVPAMNPQRRSSSIPPRRPAPAANMSGLGDDPFASNIPPAYIRPRQSPWSDIRVYEESSENPAHTTSLDEHVARQRGQRERRARERMRTEGPFFNRRDPPAPPEPPLPGLDDANDDRPTALEDADMMVMMRCAICYSQISTVALLPCGHLCMCKWCQKQAVPSHHADSTQPRDKDAKCPVCRRTVKKMARIYGPEEIAPRRSKPARSAVDAIADISADVTNPFTAPDLTPYPIPTLEDVSTRTLIPRRAVPTTANTLTASDTTPYAVPTLEQTRTPTPLTAPATHSDTPANIPAPADAGTDAGTGTGTGTDSTTVTGTPNQPAGPSIWDWFSPSQ